MNTQTITEPDFYKYKYEKEIRKRKQVEWEKQCLNDEIKIITARLTPAAVKEELNMITWILVGVVFFSLTIGFFLGALIF